MKQSFVHRILIVLAFALVVAGCGERTLPQKTLYPVTGKVTMDGKPVAFAIVHLNPKDGKGAEATGYTDADGNFSLRTYSNTEMDGAAAGEYDVEVEPYNMVKYMGQGPQAGQKPTKIPQEKRNPETPVIIESGGDTTIDIQL